MSLVQGWRCGWRDEAVAIVLPDGRAIQYGELSKRVERAAGALQSWGLRPGDVLALQLPKSIEFIELFLGALASGVATLPLNEQYTPEEAHALVADAGARLAVFDDAGPPDAPTAATVRRSAARAALDAAPAAALPAHIDPDSLAVIAYTSGTTGRPKGARIAHRALGASVEALHVAWEWRADDILVHALPLFHIHGLFVAQLGALRAGATAVWLERFDPEAAFATIERHRATLFMGVPTFYHRFCASDASPDLSSMRLFTCGSAPLPASVQREFAHRFGASVLERYGMTEIGIVLSNPLRGERRPGSVGLPLPGVRLRITDDADADVPDGVIGEVRIAGPTLFDGYHGLPDATAAAIGDGWMRTGDLGSRSADGYVTLVGRRSDLILRGGLNVYPSEVEAALSRASGCGDLAVFGVPDPDLGERVAVAWTGPATAEALLTAAATLAPFKRPQRFHPVDALPRNALGKVVKGRLRARFGAALQVRPAVAADLDALVRGNLALAAETEALTLAADTVHAGVRAALLDGAAVYWVATLGEAVVGQLMVTREWSDWRARWVWWIQSVYVWPEHRANGVLRALHGAVEAEARAAGAAGLRLYVDTRNRGAMAAYARLGMNGDHYRVFEQMWSHP